MPVKDIVETSKRWRFLSKIDVLGSLDFWTLTVSLNSLSHLDTGKLELKDYFQSDFLEVDEYYRYVKIFSLTNHEYTHFVDATSTLWGMRHLQMLHTCLSVPVDDEAKFYLLKNTYDYIRRIRLPDYYTVVEKKSWLSATLEKSVHYRGNVQCRWNNWRLPDPICPILEFN